MIFVAILITSQLIISFYKMYDPSYERPGVDFASRFKENGHSFIYWRNVLIPQLGSTLLIYFGYLSINLFILPAIKKISFSDSEKKLSLSILRAFILIITTAYLLALGVNIITYYAKPYLVNYWDYQFLTFFGYNDSPLTDLFFGFGKAAGLLGMFIVIAGLRELVIWFIDRPGDKKEFRVLIVNNITLLGFIYCLLLFLPNPFHEFFKPYIAGVPPVFLLYIYLIFWLFPFKGDGSFIQSPVLIRLLSTTFIGTLLFIFSFSGNLNPLQFLLYWMFLLVVVTPLSWLLYRQRRDKIMQLRNMATALAKSTADLQFLRSQINPHFLFNALNTLYGTALRENAEHTSKGIQKLGDMMRFMLHENNLDFISMDKEIDYLKNYIALQKLRTESSQDIIVEDNIDEAKCNRTIAPMLLIPFVENAFKHGISLTEKSWINIRLQCAETSIFLEVRNSTHKRFETDTETDKPGIGLKNVAERLKLLYPGKHELNVSEDKNEYIVKLVIK